MSGYCGITGEKIASLISCNREILAVPDGKWQEFIKHAIMCVQEDGCKLK
jgi:hypothetical protein